MRSLRPGSWAAALLGCLALPALAGGRAASPGTELADTVNWVRMRTCHSGGERPALRESPKLDKAARRLAGGGTLAEALSVEGYAASQYGELHLTGVSNDAQVSRMLADSYCRTLLDPKYREIGAERAGPDVWLVIAAPVEVPAAADAAGVSRRILDLVNAARAAGRRCGSKEFGPAPPLVLSPSLGSAALAHSQEMARYNAFDHQGHDGSTPSVRVERAGYGPHRIVGENIAWGTLSASQAVAGWLGSPPHCENVMDPRFTQMGVAFAENARSSASLYWTQDFAAPR
ncbi:MAG TPA: CAP domain-containing protein [Steroidobacteraceae bacterium]|nr:CAP domain-containing protein [Steroidobacteraceae bacterium]